VKDEGGKVLVMHNGEWTDVEKYGLTRAAIIETTKSLYGVAKVSSTSRTVVCMSSPAI
jgi:hypothetical protein